jgi:hypothetical protein
VLDGIGVLGLVVSDVVVNLDFERLGRPHREWRDE